MRRTLILMMFALSRCSSEQDDDDASSVSPTPIVDADNDGHGAATDCNDADPGVYPGATETCNGIDDDCTGTIDDAPQFPLFAFWPDADLDSWAGIETCTDQYAVQACAAPPGYDGVCGDCDDHDNTVYPYAVEVCGDRKDNNCNGIHNEGCP